jgi:hypothetical protein
MYNVITFCVEYTVYVFCLSCGLCGSVLAVICVDIATLMCRTWYSACLCKINLDLCQSSRRYISSNFLGHSRKILSLLPDLFP